ncbi:MAG TPA: hypothetical protein VD926_16170 [Acidimicrobiales bacterium]|nr:hypothetical protein [Acidimicrobiales bacterium]
MASFLPWAEVTTSLLRTTEASVSGWDWYDGSVQTGPVFAAFALIVAGLAGLTFAGTARNPARLGLVAAGALTLGLAIYALVDVLGDGDDLETIGSVDVEVSYGIAVLVVASIAVIGAGILAEPES